MQIKFQKYFRTFSGPFAVVRACNFCNHVETVKKGIPGAGRGYGMREGNKARGRMIQHIKENHLTEIQTMETKR
jgi:hypothetical protein